MKSVSVILFVKAKKYIKTLHYPPKIKGVVAVPLTFKLLKSI